jgi:DNA-binding transcriptional MerR regulator
MAQAMEDMLAVSDKRAVKLAGISMRQLRYWEQIGLVVPSVREQISPRNVIRLYSFQDLLELLVAAQLRHRPGISLQHIQRVVAYLRDRDFDAPLRELKFATRGREIYFKYPDGTWSGDPAPDQLIYHQVLALEDVGAKIDTVSGRDPEAAGRVVRRRGVQSSKPIFAGTRIPVGAVQRYLQAGYDTKAIIREYPSLTPADIDAARQYAAAG